MKEVDLHSHSTRAEIKFLMKLGTHYCGNVNGKWCALVPAGEDPEGRRQRLLSNYLSSMPARVDWGIIDPGRVQEYLREII